MDDRNNEAPPLEVHQPRLDTLESRLDDLRAELDTLGQNHGGDISTLTKRLDGLAKRVAALELKVPAPNQPGRNCPHCRRLLQHPEAKRCGVCGKEVTDG